MKECGIKMKSSITLIKAGGGETTFSHVAIFRRQIFINSHDVNKLPPSLQIRQDDITFQIYLSTQNITCFLCNKEGHIAKHCRETVDPTIYNKNNENNEDTMEQETIFDGIENDSLVSQTTQKDDKDKERVALFKTPNSAKRNYPQSSSSDNTEKDLSAHSKNNKIKTHIKKTKTGHISISPAFIDEQFNIAKNIIPTEKIPDYPISIEKLIDFIKKSLEISYKEINNTANEYTADKKSLALMMKDFYPGFTDYRIKSRFTKITKRLTNPELAELSESGADDESMQQ